MFISNTSDWTRRNGSHVFFKATDLYGIIASVYTVTRKSDSKHSNCMITIPPQYTNIIGMRPYMMALYKPNIDMYDNMYVRLSNKEIM